MCLLLVLLLFGMEPTVKSLLMYLYTAVVFGTGTS